jgi:hypothetical protein
MIGFIFLGALGCTTLDRRDFLTEEFKYQLVADVPPFQSIRDAIVQSKNYKSEEMTSLRNALIASQSSREEQIQKNKTIQIAEGHSYEFEFESFCLDPGRTSPSDEVFFRPSKADLPHWLKTIVSQYKAKGLSQKDTQLLIWSLRSGMRFDEMNVQDQNNIKKIFSDAPIRFGNSQIEDFVEDNFLPSQVKDAISKFESFKALLKQTNRSYDEISKILAPRSKEVAVQKASWVQFDSGLQIRISSDGYSRVNLKIYGLETNRKPNSEHILNTLALNGFVITPADKGQRVLLASIIPMSDKISAVLKNITAEEVKLSIKYPTDAIMVFKNAIEAQVLTGQYYNIPSDDTESNAFKHFVWSGLSSRDIGREQAQMFLDAHEMNASFSKDSSKMDRHNNKKGLDAADIIPKDGNFQKNLINAARAAIKNNELVILVKERK